MLVQVQALGRNGHWKGRHIKYLLPDSLVNNEKMSDDFPVIYAVVYNT